MDLQNTLNDALVEVEHLKSNTGLQRAELIERLESIQNKLAQVSRSLEDREVESASEEEDDDSMDEQRLTQNDAAWVNRNFIHVPADASPAFKALGALVNDVKKEQEFATRCVNKLANDTDQTNIISTKIKILIRNELTKGGIKFPRELNAIKRRFAAHIDKLRHRIELQLLDDPTFLHNHFTGINKQYYQPSIKKTENL